MGIVSIFQHRLSCVGILQEHKDSDWGGADSVVFVAGKGEEETDYWVSVAAHGSNR